jgi:serine phosphatase RsbU (regulator of sigma subunit)
MKPQPLDDLVLLPESEALQRHFDARNWRVFRGLLVISLLFSLIAGVAAAKQGHFLVFVLYASYLIATIFLFASRKEPWFERYYRQIQTSYLLLQTFAWSPGILGLKKGPELAGVLPWVYLSLRLRPAEALLLYGVYWALQALPLAVIGLGEQTEFNPGKTVGAILLLIGSLALTRVQRRRFLAQWRREHYQARERLRMQEEIEYARRIQLSMLPQGPPQVEWLELAAASMPATEVGGDYYDYFRLSPSQVVLVIGDVAGHGMASGILLSGVRSCLYLLEEHLASPVQVLARLSPMVRRTTDRRMYVTLLAAVLDREAGTLTVANAGHPPVLRRGSGGWEEVGKGAPPLGTFRDARFEADTRPLAAGDLLVLYTDGLVEARDDAGLEYGQDRLLSALDRAGEDARPAEIREAVLGDLALFRGGAESEDDVTLVVARVG